ncbi:MAG: NUDIX hydrolase [Anaerolineae bacterium]
MEPPEALVREGDHCPHVCFDGYIGQDKGGTTTVCLNPAHGLYAPILIYVGDDNRRAEHLPSHKGQISLPGGARDPGESFEETALREVHEELDVEPASIQVLGRLTPLYISPSN